MTSRRLEDRFAALLRRRAWLDKKITESRSVNGYLRSERSAIQWAIDLALEKYPELGDVIGDFNEDGP